MTEGSRHKVQKMDSVWPWKNQNGEVDIDFIEVISVSSGSDVVPCFLSPDSLAPFDLLTDTGCCPQRFVSQFKESFCYASSTQISPKEGKDLLQQQQKISFGEEQRHVSL